MQWKYEVITVTIFLHQIGLFSTFNSAQLNLRSIKNPSIRDKILIKIFNNYKKHERPLEEILKQTEVFVNMHILAISSVDVLNMAYNADFYLRQSWLDKRLAWDVHLEFKNYTKPISISSLLNYIWLPDLFFRNGKEGFMYKMTKPNYLLRLNEKGQILYSQKITMRFSCQMHLSNFPMDQQECNINIGSYGYTLDDLQFFWNSSPAVTQAKDIQISEFDTPLTLNTMDCTGTVKTSTGRYSCLKATFSLDRQLGSYLVSTYIPAILIVIVSWLSFWISVEAVPARVTLGLLTLLGILTQSKGLSGSLPRVSYIKAIDIYIIACILFIIGALTEFAIASIYHRRQKYEAWDQWIRATLREELFNFSNNFDKLDCPLNLSKPSTNNKSRTCFKSYFNSDPIIKTNSNKNYTILSLQSKNHHKNRHKTKRQKKTCNFKPTLRTEDELDRLLCMHNPEKLASSLTTTSMKPSRPVDESTSAFISNYNQTTKSDKQNTIISLDNDQIRTRITEILESKPDFMESNEMFDCSLDSYSRFLFPAFFLLYNCVYWFYYIILSVNHF